MLNLRLNKKVSVTATAAMVLLLLVMVPYVGYAAASSPSGVDPASRTVILRARGIAVTRIGNETIQKPVNLTLTLEPTRRNKGVILFEIVSGEVEVEGKTYTITQGRGIVVHNKNSIAFECEGSASEGDVITMKITGQYLWMWGRLFAARLSGRLSIDSTVLFAKLRAIARYV